MPIKVRRVVPNIQTSRVDETRKFFHEFLGMDLAMDMGWIATFASPVNPTAQVSVLRNEDSAEPSSSVSLSVEVDDVEAAYTQAKAAGYEIVYPLTVEPWGVIRFHVLDPNGLVVNVMCHEKKNP